MAPDADATVSQPPATHLSSSHSINQITSHEIKSSHYMLALKHNAMLE
jgi:hypothetical protein